LSGQRPPSIGIVVDHWDGEYLVVGSCKPGSPAARGGFRPGDVITSMAGLLAMEFLEQPLRDNVARVELLREGCELVLYLEFANLASASLATPASAAATQPAADVDPFNGMFSDRPAAKESLALLIHPK
jgi:PDZ domain